MPVLLNEALTTFQMVCGFCVSSVETNHISIPQGYLPQNFDTARIGGVNKAFLRSSPTSRKHSNIRSSSYNQSAACSRPDRGCGRKNACALGASRCVVGTLRANHLLISYKFYDRYNHIKASREVITKAQSPDNLH